MYKGLLINAKYSASFQRLFLQVTLINASRWHDRLYERESLNYLLKRVIRK